MNPDKKHLEILLINYFRENFSDFPKGKIISSESPDFIVQLKNRHRLGIELTRLNPENALLPNARQLGQIAARENFIQSVRDLVEKDINHRLFVKFLFSDEIISPEKELISAVRTANIIRNKISAKKRESFFSVHIPSAEIPDELEEIRIVHHPNLQNPVWERSNNLGISNDVIDDIRLSILKKDEKLRLYQKQRLNYYWLLIVTDRLRGLKNFNLQNRIQNHTFQSQFQQVYLFDLIKSHIFELV